MNNHENPRVGLSRQQRHEIASGEQSFIRDAIVDRFSHGFRDRCDRLGSPDIANFVDASVSVSRDETQVGYEARFQGGREGRRRRTDSEAD